MDNLRVIVQTEMRRDLLTSVIRDRIVSDGRQMIGQQISQFRLSVTQPPGTNWSMVLTVTPVFPMFR